MAIREIKLMGESVLRTPTEDVESFDEELEELVEDMLETMYHAQGIGLAAPQVGVPRRVLVVDLGEADEEGVGPLALVNARVVESSKEKDRGPEGCLSIPGLEEVVERPESVTVQGYDPQGREVSLEASGLLARALQHEVDHTDGILFVDRVSPFKRKLLMKKWKKSRAELDREAS